MVESAFNPLSDHLLTGKSKSESYDQSLTRPSHEHGDVPRFLEQAGDASKARPDAKKNGQNSVISTTSSLGSHSVKSPSPLDNPNFAPPPPRPIRRNHTMSQFMAKHEPEKKLPSYEKVTHSGTCLGRFSLMSLMIRRWKPIFWITYGERSLLFFRSQQHFEDWLTNKYLTKRERTSLVKLHVNFVTDFENDDVRGYQVSRIKSKWYNNGGILHNFKLDRWYFDGGPTIAGAFAASTHDGIYDLHTIMDEMANRSPQNKRFIEIIKEMAGYGSDQDDTEGFSVKSSPMFQTMFTDDDYYSPRQADAYFRMRSAASC